MRSKNFTNTEIAGASSLQHSRYIRAGIPSGPVAVSTFNNFRIRRIVRERIKMNSGICTATLSHCCLGPDNGGGSADFVLKTVAKTFALALASNTHLPASFNGGMDDVFDFLCNNSLFHRHQILECSGRARMRSRKPCLYAIYAPRSTSLQRADVAANSLVPAAADFSATVRKQASSNQGCDAIFMEMVLRGMCSLQLSLNF